MLTIFSLPKAFAGHISVIQHNAIGSWVRLGRGCEVMLLGDDSGVAEAAKIYGARHVGQVARTDRGTPILKDAFDKAARTARHPLLCYVNADIILLDDFLDAVRVVLERYENQDFLMVGRRWDLDIGEPLNFAPNWQVQLKSRVDQEGQLLTAAASDYFVYRPPLVADMPRFAVGRPMWDNWLMYQARRTRTPLIDATGTATVVHQNHDYGHVSGGKTGVWKGPEAKMNFVLAGGPQCYYTVYDSTYLIGNGELVSTFWPRYLPRHGQALLWRFAVRLATNYPSTYQVLRRLRRAILPKRWNEEG